MKPFLRLSALAAALFCPLVWGAFPTKFPTLESFGLKPKVVEYSYHDIQRRTGDPMYNLSFGKITFAQYRKVKRYFLDKSKVKYAADREYFLTDFLPPQMQALYGLNFTSRATFELSGFHEFMYDLKMDQDTMRMFSTAYCYGTAWNNVVSLQSNGLTPFYFGHVSYNVANQYLLNDEYGRPLAAGEPEKFGDVIAIYNVNENGWATIGHAPMYLIDGLIFEKEDSHNNTPFQIVAMEDTIQGVRAMVGAWGNTITVIKRRLLGNPKRLPSIAEVGVYKGEETDEKIRRIFGERFVGRLTIDGEDTMGGGFRPGMELLKEVRFGTDQEGRGRLRDITNFSPAFKGITCDSLYSFPSKKVGTIYR